MQGFLHCRRALKARKKPLQLLLPEVAAQEGVAVLIDAINEVLASDADAGAFPALKLFVIDESPLLHNPLA